MKTKIKRISLLIAILSCSLVWVSVADAGIKASGGMRLEKVGYEELKLEIEKLKGKIVILDFMVTWFPPCRKEIPGFVKLTNTYTESGVVVVNVFLDKGTTKQEIEEFILDNKINYYLFWGDNSIYDKYSVKAFPTTYILDRNGEEIKKYIGFISYETIEKDIKTLLKK